MTREEQIAEIITDNVMNYKSRRYTEKHGHFGVYHFSGVEEAARQIAALYEQEAAGQRWWWLYELGPHGYGKPVDGPHESREGVEEAAYLFARLGLQRDRQFVCAEVIETPVEPKPHGANEEAIGTLNAIGLQPQPAGGEG